MQRAWRVIRSFVIAASIAAATIPAAVEAPPSGRAPFEGVRVAAAQAEIRVSEVKNLSTLPWRSATTGWQVLADRDVPNRDYSFTWEPMTVSGETFARGLSTYPFSEIVYDLDSNASQFTARVGVTDDSAGGSVRFFVYGDDLMLYQSDIVRAGEPARSVDVEVSGLSQLRLIVDDAGDGSLGDYALWGNPTVSLSDDAPSASAIGWVAQARRNQTASQREKLAIEEAGLKERSTADKALINERLALGAAARGAFDQQTSLALLVNGRIGVVMGFGGPRNGRLTVFDRLTDLPTLVDVSPRLITEDGARLTISDMQPDTSNPLDFRRIQDPTAGGGQEVTLRFRKPQDLAPTVAVTLTVFDRDSALGLGVKTSGIRLRSVQYLNQSAGSLVLGNSAHYLTDRSHLYTGDIRRDGHTRRAPLQATEPGLIWSDEVQRGVLLAFFDYVPSPAWLSVRGEAGRRGLSVGLELSANLDDFGPDAGAPPPLSIELIKGPLGVDTFRRYRGIVNARYPAEPMPTAARYQWGSWYTYGPGVSAATFLHQADLLAQRLGDLGDWQMLLDAGWYVQYGREDAELANVDTAKFPNGVRGVADAVHAHGMDLILYLGTGFVHDSTGNGGEWLALTGLIERQPDWLIPFQSAPSSVRRYLLDYNKPEVREYISSIIRDFFVVHGADGILIDGLADAEGQLIPRAERDTPAGPPHPLLPTIDIYRLVRQVADAHYPNAFIASGWLNPPAADPYTHIYFYGDESDQVDAPYPFAGFLQKLDYALFSRLALGQRQYIGAAIGDPRRPDSRWWAQASAALGTPGLLALDVGDLDRRTLTAYRADLREVDAYTGTTTFGPGLFPDTFATTRDGVTYLGVVNRETTARNVPIGLRALGLDAPSYTALNVNTEEGRVVDGDFTVTVPGLGFRYLVLKPTVGLLRSSSMPTDLIADAEAGLIAITASGPAEATGFAQFVSPPPARVLVDGRPALRVSNVSGVFQQGGEAGGTDLHYAYDDASRILTVGYAHSGPRSIEVRW